MVKVADLADLLDVDRKGEFLYCPTCDGRYSATRGDYFMVPTDEPFTCGDCDEPMILATERTVIEVVLA